MMRTEHLRMGSENGVHNLNENGVPEMVMVTKHQTPIGHGVPETN